MTCKIFKSLQQQSNVIRVGGEPLLAVTKFLKCKND